MTFPHKVLHLTIAPDGTISYWDNRDRAELGKQDNEIHLELMLTLKQTQLIKDAVKAAKKGNKKGGK